MFSILNSFECIVGSLWWNRLLQIYIWINIGSWGCVVELQLPEPSRQLCYQQLIMFLYQTSSVSLGFILLVHSQKFSRKEHLKNIGGMSRRLLGLLLQVSPPNTSGRCLTQPNGRTGPNYTFSKANLFCIQ